MRIRSGNCYFSLSSARRARCARAVQGRPSRPCCGALAVLSGGYPAAGWGAPIPLCDSPPFSLPLGHTEFTKVADMTICGHYLGLL